MTKPEGNGGWDASAEAWVAAQGEHGDWGRRFVLDAPMLARVRRRPFARALDVGCGEGRFARMLAAEGIDVVGVDPVEALVARARARHPGGDYRVGRAEALPVPDAAFDLVVSYLTLIDVPDLRAAVAEMTRALAPGGALLIANLTSFCTAYPERERLAGGGVVVDRYMEERPTLLEWSGIRVENWHRPLATYMRLLLDAGLRLRHFDEPPPAGGDPERMERYLRAPWFVVMEWSKP